MSDEYFAGTSRAVRKSCAKTSLAVVSQLDQGCFNPPRDKTAVVIDRSLMSEGRNLSLQRSK